MNKWWKITLYVVLVLTIIAVVRLMFWNTNPNVEIQNDTDIDTNALTWENAEDITGNINAETPSFEEDVMKDLEWFFGTNNGYEDVQWEYWFTSPENE
jgi:flagellar basal body-associated protein FliL